VLQVVAGCFRVLQGVAGCCSVVDEIARTLSGNNNKQGDVQAMQIIAIDSHSNRGAVFSDG